MREKITWASDSTRKLRKKKIRRKSPARRLIFHRRSTRNETIDTFPSCRRMCARVSMCSRSRAAVWGQVVEKVGGGIGENDKVYRDASISFDDYVFKMRFRWSAATAPPLFDNNPRCPRPSPRERADSSSSCVTIDVRSLESSKIHLSEKYRARVAKLTRFDKVWEGRVWKFCKKWQHFLHSFDDNI